jgi:hypothetical protein
MVFFQIFFMSVDHINYMQLHHCSQGFEERMEWRSSTMRSSRGCTTQWRGRCIYVEGSDHDKLGGAGQNKEAGDG